MSGAGDRLPLPESRQLSDPGMRATRGGVREAAEQRPGSSESQENPAQFRMLTTFPGKPTS